MKKTSSFLTLSLLIGLVPAVAAVRLAKVVPGVALLEPARALNAFPAAAAQGSVWKSQDEYNAYQAMATEKDPQKKIALAEAFLQKYPDSAVKNYVYGAMMNAYQQAGDAPNAIATAKKILEIDANNLDALRYLSFAFPFTFKPDAPDAPAQLSRAESDAKHGLDLLSKVQKPANVTDEQFQQALKPVRDIFNSAVGFVALQRKDYPAAITSFKAALEDNPSDLYAAYRMGVSYLLSAPPDYNNGFWYIARAVALGRAAKTSDTGGIEKYLDQAYGDYHGNKDGLEDIITQAATSPDPPQGFQVAALKPPEKTGNPNIDSFNQITFPLKLGGSRAQSAWSQLKGQPLGLGGFVNSVEKGSDPGSYIVKISLDQSKAETSYDIALQDSTQPKVGDLNPGDPLRFQGTIDSYTATPTFSLTLSNGKINDDDLEAATAKAKTKPRRHK
jgi:tetratricopeptide (TPR) repeat protein